MTKAITEGLALMPLPFASGLANWSSLNGRPGDPGYAGQPNAGLVTGDVDFGSCLELQKTSSTQRIRAFAQTPLRADMMLKVSVRLKAVAGNLPSARIAAWAGNASGSNVGAVPQTAAAVTLASYGQVVTLSAIIAAGNRSGVDLVWGAEPVFAHIGLDLTGANGGTVRIEDIRVEDVTLYWLRDMLDLVDVRDHGAKGDGVSNDLAAFQRADAAAAGRSLLVPAGSFALNGNLTIAAPIRFVGTLVMPAANRLVLTRNFDLESYSRAFGGDTPGFRRALQALFYFSDHVSFDMSGRRVELDAPLDIAALSGQSSFSTRRVLRNGALNAVASTAWNTEAFTASGTYNPATSHTRLTGVTSLANIPVGALVEGAGVGREVYVRSKNVGAGWLELSQPLYGGAGTRSYSFRRFKYMLDFSAFSLLSRFEIKDVEFNCEGIASGVMLPATGSVNRFQDCLFNRPRERAISSAGTGCQGIMVDHCQFHSDEQSTPSQNRRTIALNVNANDAKIRNNRVVRFRHFAVLNGTSHMIQSNHFFQGDDETAGLRLAGIILTQTNVATVITGNYVDNCFIEWGNEHDAQPEFNNEFSFGGLNITGNIFIASDVSPAFRWLVVKPYGPGHFLNGFAMENNSFRVFNATIERVERQDNSLATLDFARSRDVRIQGNTFNQVSQSISNPLLISHVQNTAAETWTVDGAGFIPFGGRIRMVEAVQSETALTNAANVARYIAPSAWPGQGTGGNQVTLRWGEAVKGRAVVRMRMDLPV